MFVRIPAHTKITRILGEKRLDGIVDVTLWRSSPCSGFVVTRFRECQVQDNTAK